MTGCSNQKFKYFKHFSYHVRHWEPFGREVQTYVQEVEDAAAVVLNTNLKKKFFFKLIKLVHTAIKMKTI